jgi:hypothetical protein
VCGFAFINTHGTAARNDTAANHYAAAPDAVYASIGYRAVKSWKRRRIKQRQPKHHPTRLVISNYAIHFSSSNRLAPPLTGWVLESDIMMPFYWPMKFRSTASGIEGT